MPEIPELELYVRQLSQTVLGKKIEQVEINREKSINVPTEVFQKLVAGQGIVAISRRAKHFILTVENGYKLVGHLMLGGRLYWALPGEEVKTRGSLIFHFPGGSRLYCINFRLGWLHVLTEEEVEERFASLGPEPLGSQFSLAMLGELLAPKKGAIKPLLTEQSFIAGIGNCYSDEILFKAGIRPERKANEIKERELASFYRAIPLVLKEAIANGGYMDKPFSQGDTLTGGHNDHLLVYDRESEPCYQCQDKVVLTTLSGKKSYFCPTCQV